ncbi:Aminotransferase [Phycisphaerae bacterium RAS1]|nr:Aminotransferase [Phycisphaerae bacterium RAS1]
MPTVAETPTQKSITVPLLDLKAQYRTIEGELRQAVMEVVESTQYIMGAKVEELEKKLAAYCGAKHGIGVTSGTDALLVALMALDVKPGDVVVTTPYSFFATAGVVARLSATPAFVDIDADTFNMCPQALRRWFESHRDKLSRVKAIIPVHLFGQCADMDPILAVAREFNVPIIEDAAQAIGSRYPSKTLGGVKKAGQMGRMACFSFFPSKNLGCMGDGGMLTTDDDALAEKLRMLRNHGAKPKYYHSMVGGNFRLDTLQAAVLCAKLPHLDKWHGMRQTNATWYDEHLNAAGLKKPKIAWGREHHIYNQYVILVPSRRDELRKHLSDARIGNEVYYPVSLHEQECFKYLGYKRGDFPHSEHAARHSVAIPIYPELTREMQAHVAEQIGRFYA